MGKILQIVESMGGEIIERKPRIIDSIVRIQCSCNHISEVTAGAVYKQHRRGHDSYICKSCAGANGWTDIKREIVGKISKEKWKDPNYAGTVIGKNVANQIKKITKVDWLS